MNISLKDQNKPMLALVLLGNAILYLGFVQQWISTNGWQWIEKLMNVQELVPVASVSILAGIVNAQVGHDNKARLVFWKWNYPLPGCRAFTEYMNRDPRIDREFMQETFGPLPSIPDKQNALWFKWYRQLQGEPAIKQVHREYLFARDYACIAFMLMIGLGCLSLWQLQSVNSIGLYLAILVAQYLLVRRAAYNHGIRFVCSVLAYKASGDQQAG